MRVTHHYCWLAHWWHTPMAPWVHRRLDGPPLHYAPPAPTPAGERGYAALCVRVGPHELVFSSPEQLDHFIEVLSRKPLPRPARLIADAGLPGGPNGHWLSRLPTDLKGPGRHRWLPRLQQLRDQLADQDWRREASRD